MSEETKLTDEQMRAYLKDAHEELMHGEKYDVAEYMAAIDAAPADQVELIYAAIQAKKRHVRAQITMPMRMPQNKSWKRRLH